MKKTVVAGLVPTLTTIGMMVAEGSAPAISRVSCSSYDYTWVLSNRTTCWANAGSASVALDGVYGVNSGNNTGWLASPAGYVYFPSRYTHYDCSSRTVDVVHIN